MLNSNLWTCFCGSCRSTVAVEESLPKGLYCVVDAEIGLDGGVFATAVKVLEAETVGWRVVKRG